MSQGKKLLSVTMRQKQRELLAMALQYCIVADWFESRSAMGSQDEQDAMDLFNRIEGELRKAGRRVLWGGDLRGKLQRAAGLAGGKR